MILCRLPAKLVKRYEITWGKLTTNDPDFLDNIAVELWPGVIAEIVEEDPSEDGSARFTSLPHSGWQEMHRFLFSPLDL